jgi:hypothetical protein
MDAEGGHEVDFEGVTYVDSEPFTYSTSPLATTIAPFASPDAGATIFGFKGLRGKSVLSGAGAPEAGLGTAGDFYIDTAASKIYGPKAGGWGAGTSLIGPQGEAGAKGSKGDKGDTGSAGGGQGAYTGLVVPMHNANGGLKCSTNLTPGTANKAFFVLCLIEKSGRLKGIRVPNGSTSNGTTRVAAFDCGKAASGKFTLLAEAEAAHSGASKWQYIKLPGEGVSVEAGQLVMLAVMNSGATGSYAGGTGYLASGHAELEETISGWPAAMGKVLFSGTKTFGGFAYATITREELTPSTNAYVLGGQVE